VYNVSLCHLGAFFSDIALWTAVGAVSHRLSQPGSCVRHTAKSSYISTASLH